MKETVNEDTYQTLKEVEVTSYEKATLPMWKPDTGQKETKKINKSPYSLMVCTPCHSEVAMHYTQALLELQQLCIKNGIKITFTLLKSSLVTQGRNLCTSAFLESNCTHMLFVDSDIYFRAESIIKMLDLNKELVSIPYPLKTMMWDKLYKKWNDGEVKNPQDIHRFLNTYPMKVENPENIKLDNGVMEVTHSPTGCMLIKRSVFDKMIEKYPDKNIVQKTVINGEYVDRPNLWNFFDCIHDPETKTYMGEDFSFCKLWKDIGGKCYAYVNDPIIHVGEHQYEGRFLDELKLTK
jgi:predicted metal-binding protein